MPKSFFAVIRRPGPAWVENKPLREQADWEAHARFMNGLAAQGWIIMGGPLGGGPDVLLIVEADDEQHVYETLRRDPWTSAGILALSSVRQWTVLLDSRKK